MTETQNSWIGGLMAIGAAVSCVPTGHFTDKIGRKMTMLALVPIFLIGWALTIWASCVSEKKKKNYNLITKIKNVILFFFFFFNVEII